MKFTDVNPFNKKVQKKINNSILNTVKKGDFILGEKVKKFENQQVQFNWYDNHNYQIKILIF